MLFVVCLYVVDVSFYCSIFVRTLVGISYNNTLYPLIPTIHRLPKLVCASLCSMANIHASCMMYFISIVFVVYQYTIRPMQC